jgi:predicted chitinase
VTPTVAQLAQVMPHAQHLDELGPLLVQAMSEAHIDTPVRAAAFVAQLAHESGELRYMEELGDGHQYEGRADLGNAHAGDGPRYKGRGPIQLTGRANYAAAERALGVLLEANPELAAMPAVGFRVACWFWTSRNLNALADLIPGASVPSLAFDAITKRVNGGLNGKPARDVYFALACASFGCAIPAVPVCL